MNSETQADTLLTKSTKPLKSAESLSLTVLAALGLAALAVVVSIAVWWDTRANQQDIIQLLGGKIAELDKLAKDVVARQDALQRDTKDAQNRVAQLDSKIAEFQNQRVAIEEMTRDLARAPEDWLLAEIEQTLNIASRELTLAGNVRAAIAALQSADQRLSRADKLQATPLRRAITQDLERLKATPALDTQGIIVKLDLFMLQSATLPLAVPTLMTKELTSNSPASTQEKSWAEAAWRDFWREMKDIIRIRELEPTEAALITPQQSVFVRESLKLRLLSARTSLLARDDVNFKEDIKAARELLTKYFDPKARANQNAIAGLKLLSENTVSIATPDIVQSMNAVRDARNARDSRAKNSR
jgi:uroporphyrin-III C-methyltransferase